MGEVSRADIYGFDPSIVPCIVFIVLFALLAGHHLYIMIRKKCTFWWPFLTGIIFEVIGYIARIPSSQNKGAVGPYAIQTLFILLPPAFFAASIYMTLGRMLVYIKAESVSWVKIRWMTGLFVTGDVLSFLLQAAGGGLQSSPGNQEMGSNIVIGGLVVQLVFFGLFVVTSGIADYKLRKMHYNPKTPGKLQWRVLLYSLYAASVLILVRSIFRVIEYAQGYGGYLMTHEVFMYVFDAVLMFFVVVIFSICHPAEVLTQEYAVHIDDETEMEFRGLSRDNQVSVSDDQVYHYKHQY